MESFWCCDCNAPSRLDTHGRCATCGSSSVDTMERPNREQAKRNLSRWKEELQRDLRFTATKIS